ncbi:hypothetical protein H6P81_020362 [Aristolochia fimbriata]|uniref:pectinesterase n=1 Tax=Aristolochia fimbriata TaxID=158543 RepID=A0AAV7DUA4_ARIFI|nr:hypothetical protein H6P81_020362 [Aristolochia fimbriata]
MSRKASESQEIPEDQILEDDYIEPDPPNPEMVAYMRRRAQRQRIVMGVSAVILFITMGLIGFSGVLGPRRTEGSGTPSAGLFGTRVEAFCQLTDFDDVCASSIERYTVDGSESDVTPKMMTLYCLRAAIDDVGTAYNYSREVVNGGKKKLNETLVRSFADCETRLRSALDDLNLAYEDTDSMTLAGSPYQLLEILTALSAATAYEQACADGLAAAVAGGDSGEEAEMVMGILGDATKETRNSLAIAAGSRGEAFATRVGSPPPAAQAGGRKWLSEGEAEEEEPFWFPAKGRPDVVVAQDGSGNFKTITEALKAVPKVRDDRFEIYVKEGIYEETVIVTDEMKYVTMYGDGTQRTIVTGNKSTIDGLSTAATATAAILGKQFMARNMSFENTAGRGKGAGVALRVESDLSVFYNCRIEGYDSTLLAFTRRQFYRNCVISGAVDIVHGDAIAVFQSCQILVKEPPRGRESVIIVQSRLDRHEITGTVIQNCTVTSGTGASVPTYLGRPVKERSRIVVMESYLGSLIEREGWAPPSVDNATILESSFVAEFGNRGPGADVLGRVKWPAFHLLLDEEQVASFTVHEFIQGSWWLNLTGTPFIAGLIRG